MGMRLTAHNGRAGKDGTYSAKHNDRNFDERQADHIDPERSRQNYYWHRYMQGNEDKMTFEDAEALFYERHFRAALDERNERSIAQRHPERVKTMDDYRQSQKTCPEEQIMQIGRDGQTIDRRQLWSICAQQISWEQKQFPNFKILDIALHADEQGAPHIHKRGVWVAHDEDGREIVGQAKALREMGIEAPDPSKAYGKYNNAKMTYTRQCREHFAELCLARGLDMELEPREHSKSGLALEEYKAQQEQEKALQAQMEAQRATEQHARMAHENARMASEMQKAKESALKAQNELKTAQRALDEVRAEREDLLSQEAFSRELLTSEQTEGIEAKPTMFDKEKVVISQADFEALKRSAAAAENLMQEIKPAREVNRQAESIIEDAEQEAQSIIDRASGKADMLRERSASGQLDRVRRDFPELFKDNVYQGKEPRSRYMDNSMTLTR